MHRVADAILCIYIHPFNININLRFLAFNGTLAQQWRVIKQTNGTYRIYAIANTNYNLDVYKGYDENETAIQLYTENYNKQQTFRIWSINVAINKIMPCTSYTKVWDVYGGSDSSLYQQKVQIYNSGNGTNQQWAFEPVPQDKPFNSTYPYWGKGARTGTEAQNWYYNLLSTYTYDIRHEMVFEFNYDQIQKVHYQLSYLVNKSYAEQKRLSVLNDIISIANIAGSYIPGVGTALGAINSAQTLIGLNSSSVLNEINEILSDITLISKVGGVPRPYVGYTISLLKKDLNGYWEFKIRASTGESEFFEITKAASDSVVSASTAYAGSMKTYKVAPQYTYFWE